MSSLLYCKEASTEGGALPHGDIACFAPHPFRLRIKGGTLGWKARLVRLWFWLITGGRLRMFYCTAEDGAVAHTSCVLPKCLKFPYMEPNTYTIGPCSTLPQYRGRGIYPAALRQDCKKGSAEAVLQRGIIV